MKPVMPAGGDPSREGSGRGPGPGPIPGPIPGGATVQVATMIGMAAFLACCFDSGGLLLGGVGRYGVAITGGALLVLLLLRSRLGRCGARGWVNPLALALAVGVWAWLLTAPDQETLREQGQLLVDALEEVRAVDGVYPAALEQAGLELPASRFGWTYEAAASPPRFELSVGEYRRDGFVLRYRSDRAQWAEDG